MESLQIPFVERISKTDFSEMQEREHFWNGLVCQDIKFKQVNDLSNVPFPRWFHYII